jgi:hypothetical protein
MTWRYVSFRGAQTPRNPLPVHGQRSVGRGSRAEARDDTTIAIMRRLAALALLTIAALTASAELPFIEDDYTKAVARAKAKDVPIFVEAWAPW